MQPTIAKEADQGNATNATGLAEGFGLADLLQDLQSRPLTQQDAKFLSRVVEVLECTVTPLADAQQC